MTADEAKKTVDEQQEAFLRMSRTLAALPSEDAMIAAIVAVGSHTLMTSMILVEVLHELESARLSAD